MFADILGKPNEGIHAHRIMGFASVDLIATIIAGFILGLIFKINTIMAFIYLFILGQFFHYIFGVKTAFIKIFYE
jgi:hypothetical protein